MESNHKYELTKRECKAVLKLNGTIFVPMAIGNSVIGYYHEYLCHPGATQAESTIWGTMTWPGLTRNV
jgi:hypothetical protein